MEYEVTGSTKEKVLLPVNTSVMALSLYLLPTHQKTEKIQERGKKCIPDYAGRAHYFLNSPIFLLIFCKFDNHDTFVVLLQSEKGHIQPRAELILQRCETSLRQLFLIQ